MRLKKIDEGTLRLETKQTRWMHFFLLVVLLLCFFVAQDVFKGDLSAWWIGACSLAFLTWLGFARISTDAVAVIETKMSKFSFSSRSYFGGVSEQYSCDLGDAFDVVLEVEDSTTYRIGFVTN